MDLSQAKLKIIKRNREFRDLLIELWFKNSILEIKHGKLQCLEIHLVIKIVLIYIGALVDFHTIIEVPSPKKVIKEDAEIKHTIDIF